MTKKSILPHIISIVFFTLIAIGMIVVYFVFLQKSTQVVEESLKTCSANDNHASAFINSKPNRVGTWFFNLSNPVEYLNGMTAEFHEIGPYGFILDIIRANPEFSKKEGTFSYDAYYSVEDDSSQTCSNCRHKDVVIVPNYGYQTILGQSKNEGGILISLTCTTTQIALMSSSSPIPYCTSSQRGNSSVNCRCCRSSPLAPGTGAYCKDVLTPNSRAGGLMSYLAEHDHGFKTSTQISGFAFANGIFTSLLRKLTVNEVLWGHASTLIGTISTSQAFTAGSSATAAQKLAILSNDNTTKDLIDACYFNSTICPSISSLVGKNILLYRYAHCEGSVPSTEELVKKGLTAKRAQELKYLEGVSCKPLTPTIVLAAVLQKDPSPSKSWLCADGSTSLPCCPRVFHSNTFNLHGSGLGCVQWVPGLVQPRRVYSDEEALTTLGPLREEFGTVCASKEDRFQMHLYKGLTSSPSWYTPVTDNFPNMTWADSTLMRPGLSPGSPGGTYTSFNISGEIFGLHEGKGFEAQFLSHQLTKDKSPLKKSLSIWVAFRRSVMEYRYQREKMVKGIATNSYETHYDPTTTDAALRETQQRHGMTPYQNMVSLYYASFGRPLIMSSPHFHSSDAVVLTQTDNRPRRSDLTTGVLIFRTRDGYETDSPSLTSPQVVTPETWEQFHEAYSGHLSLEPATGVTLGGAVVNQISTMSWNCNPNHDPTCGMFFYNQSASQGRLCYRNGPALAPSFFPCSAANVFTPLVMGGKVLPIFWLRASPMIPSNVYDALHGLQRKAFISGVLVLVIPIVSFVVILVLGFAIISTRRSSQQVSSTVIELKSNQEA